MDDSTDIDGDGMPDAGDHPVATLLAVAKQFSHMCDQVRQALPEAVSDLEATVRMVRATAQQLLEAEVEADGDSKEDGGAEESKAGEADGESKPVRRRRGADLSPDALELVMGAEEDVRAVATALQQWTERQQANPRWSATVAPLRRMLEAYGTGVAVFVAASEHRWLILLAVAVLVVSVYVALPNVAAAVTEAWNRADDLKRFTTMNEDLTKRVTQLRHVLRLKEEARSSRRYDVSKSVLTPDARDFWCVQFGAENHEISTGRLIETLLFEAGDRLVTRESVRRTVYDTMARILDGNGDGTISPAEFHNFLTYFGPLRDCVRRTVESLLNMEDADNGASVWPWFSWTKLDRTTANRLLPEQGAGTFVVRVASEPGRFAMSVVGEDGMVTHYKIANCPEGYAFEGSKRYFPSLANLVQTLKAKFKKPYVDQLSHVVLNVGGHRFETHTGTLMRFPDSKLAQKVQGARDGNELFFDRDPEAFAVILNYLRTGELLVPPTTTMEAVRIELVHYNLPAPEMSPPLSHQLSSSVSMYSPSFQRADSDFVNSGGLPSSTPVTSAYDTVQEDTAETTSGSAAGSAASEPNAQPAAPPATLWDRAHHGGIAKDAAEELLRDAEDGAFLLRLSSSDPERSVVLCHKFKGRVVEQKIAKDGSTLSLKDKSYETLEELVAALAYLSANLVVSRPAQ